MGNFSYKFPNHGEIEIDSVEYIWKIRRYWGIEGNAYGKPFGLLITVYNEKIIGKNLHIEFSFSEFNWNNQPSKQQIELRLKDCVSASLKNGWDPKKRGKAFHYNA